MANPVKFYFLVAGHEYSTKGLDFDRMCTRRAQELIDTLRHDIRNKAPNIPVTPPVTLRFLRFYVKQGSIEFIDHDLDAAGGKVVALAEKTWQPISAFQGSGDYDPRTFCTSRPMRPIAPSDYKSPPGTKYPPFVQTGPTAGQVDQVMSIVDVYNAAQKMPDDSLMELSFFCHGYFGGPILVNSNDRHNTPDDTRDPTDKDGRRDKDFRRAMGAGVDFDLLKPFANSFTKTGFIQAWGCVAEPPLRHVLDQAFVKRRLKNDAVGKALRALQTVDDAATFDFDFSDVDIEPDGTHVPWTDDYPHDKTFFPAVATAKKFTRTFLDIKKFLGRHNHWTYAFHAAAATGVLTKAAFYGMEGDDEKHKRYNLLRVCLTQTNEAPPVQKECPVGYAPQLQFMKTYLSLDHDPVRGYGIYDANAVAIIEALNK